MPGPSLSQIVSRIMDPTGLRPSSVDNGDAAFTDGSIRYTLSFGRSGNLLGWTAKAEAESYREPMSKFGGVGFEIWRPARPRPPGQLIGEYRYHAPTSLDRIDPALLEYVALFGRQAVRFVVDEADLGRLQLAPAVVWRSEVRANLPEGSAAARLVKAMIVAPSTGDRDLETAIMERLGQEGERVISWTNGRTYLFRESVAGQAVRRGGRRRPGRPCQDRKGVGPNSPTDVSAVRSHVQGVDLQQRPQRPPPH